MSDIFLSYASKDRERVRQLASVLEAQDWSVFWDRTIPTGMKWHEVLGDELDASHCVVVVWTLASTRSQWVYEEAEEGKKKGALFPVKLDNVLPPLGFRTFQVANLSDWQGAPDSPALTRLLQDLEGHFHLLKQRAAAEQQREEQVTIHRQAEAARPPPVKAAPEPASPKNSTRLKLVNYNIISKLGKGGMASVYLARHTVLDREVALKVMSPKIATTEAFRQGFIREAQIVAQLEHPHIVRIYDGGTANGLFYMAMELLPGGNLKEQLESGPLLPEYALGIVRQMATALDYAHAKGYIHRDIKPANILFRGNGDAALADFGIAKLQGIVSDMTQLGLVSGTPHYMSPEQSSGQGVDPRSDLYSLGIVLYEMLTGALPYTGNTAMAVAYQHLHGAIPELTGENACYQTLFERMVAKQPADRFSSAASLLQALDTLPQASTQPVLPPSSALLPPADVFPPAADPPAPTNHRGAWLLGITVVLCLGAGGNYYLSHTEPQPDITARLAQQQVAESLKRQEQVSGHWQLAQQREQEQSLFDHSFWSGGCRNLLADTQGSYDALDSAEWHYRQILKLDPGHAEAFRQLEGLEKRRDSEFVGCDTYQQRVKTGNTPKP